MGDKPRWHLYYVKNREGRMKYDKDEFLGSVFDNWKLWQVDEPRVISFRIDLKLDLSKGDVIEMAPAKEFNPKVTRYSGKNWDFQWVFHGAPDTEKYLAHGFVNQGYDKKPRFKIYIEENIRAGTPLYQNPRRGSEDIYQEKDNN
jgi:hypothetical protein